MNLDYIGGRPIPHENHENYYRQCFGIGACRYHSQIDKIVREMKRYRWPTNTASTLSPQYKMEPNIGEPPILQPKIHSTLQKRTRYWWTADKPNHHKRNKRIINFGGLLIQRIKSIPKSHTFKNLRKFNLKQLTIVDRMNLQKIK